MLWVGGPTSSHRGNRSCPGPKQLPEVVKGSDGREEKDRWGLWKWKGAPSHSFLPEMLRGPCSSECGAGGASPGPPRATRSPVLEPVLRVLEPGLQVPDAHLLLLQWGQVLLRGRWLDAMVVAAQCVLHGAPVRGCLSARRGGKDSQAQVLCLQGARGHQPHHPGPTATRGLQARPPVWSQDSRGHENTQPFWKGGFY